MEENEYEVVIREVLERRIKQKASDREDAMEMVEADYRAGRIVLVAEDFSYHEFECNVPVMQKERSR